MAVQSHQGGGKELGIKGAEAIGWRLIGSLMSDQASTQKAFNRLVKERAELEVQERGSLDPNESGRPILETFCGMHLGVNLRTAEVHIPYESVVEVRGGGSRIKKTA